MENREIVLFQDGKITKKGMELYQELEDEINRLEAQRDNFKEIIMKEMFNLGVLRLECENSDIVIDLYEPKEKKTFDSKKFKEENQELYEKYCKVGLSNAYIKIWKRKAKETSR